MKEMKLRWKRPRYVFVEKEQNRAQKKAIFRLLKRLPKGTVVIIIDEVILRWFPPLRSAWGEEGEQIEVPITGRNAKRVLFGSINPRTGHRVILTRQRMWQEDFQVFLRLLRKRYGNRPIALLLDEASCHTAAGSRRLAAALHITLIWLPKQCSELNIVDHLWRALKQLIAANRQFKTMDEEAAWAERWFLGMSDRTALRKAGALSKKFWLQDFS